MTCVFTKNPASTLSSYDGGQGLVHRAGAFDDWSSSLLLLSTSSSSSRYYDLISDSAGGAAIRTVYVLET
eukprot:scaffold25826_cov132-Cylindrotheca_fusiformis.AAC.1